MGCPYQDMSFLQHFAEVDRKGPSVRNASFHAFLQKHQKLNGQAEDWEEPKKL